jgi:hypothetical protein
MSKVGRNDDCPCGSGLKYKRCHGSVLKSTASIESNVPLDATIFVSGRSSTIPLTAIAGRSSVCWRMTAIAVLRGWLPVWCCVLTWTPHWLPQPEAAKSAESTP